MEFQNCGRRKNALCSGLGRNNEVCKKLTEVYARLKSENEIRIVINGEPPSFKPPRVVNLDFSTPDKENLNVNKEGVKLNCVQSSVIKRVKYNI